MKKFLAVAVPFLSIASYAADAGTTSLGFLTEAAGARAAAMGEAQTALADDATALYWNPASLARQRGKSAVVMHQVGIESSYFDYAAYSSNLGDRAGWGLGLQYMNHGSIERLDALGNPDGSFTPSDLALSLGYARRAGPVVLGGSGRYITSKLVDSGSTFAADLGAEMDGLMDDKLRLGLVVANLGGKIKYEAESQDLPMTIRAGAGFKLKETWIWGLDLGFPKDGDTVAGLGTEYGFNTSGKYFLAARGGYTTRTKDVEGLAGFTLGLGVKTGGIGIDYALVPLGDLGMTHKVSLSFSFGQPEPAPTPRAAIRAETAPRPAATSAPTRPYSLGKPAAPANKKSGLSRPPAKK